MESTMAGRGGKGVLALESRRTGQIVCGQTRVAGSFWTRLRGLLGRSELAHGEGLWIVPSTGVHTFGMTFAIDVVMLDGSQQIVGLRADIPPGRLAGLRCGAASALELRSGMIAELGLRLGDPLYVVANPADDSEGSSFG